jgi:aspartyl-tRNA(Asn)/glutamyl-tRNA(Gln) amidotransferase subunit B
VLDQHPEQVCSYLKGKESLYQWLFGEIMRSAGGKANPQVLQEELSRQLEERRASEDRPI